MICCIAKFRLTSAITEFSFEFRSYADGEYRIADVRTGRAYADGWSSR